MPSDWRGPVPGAPVLPFGVERWALAFTHRGAQVRPIWFTVVSGDGLSRLELPQCDGLRNLARARGMPMPSLLRVSGGPRGLDWRNAGVVPPGATRPWWWP